MFIIEKKCCISTLFTHFKTGLFTALDRENEDFTSFSVMNQMSWDYYVIVLEILHMSYITWSNNIWKYCVCSIKMAICINISLDLRFVKVYWWFGSFYLFFKSAWQSCYSYHIFLENWQNCFHRLNKKHVKMQGCYIIINADMV